ncbi:hypothetical protein QFC21_003326 [Naganishia friedmannii]|uniref:Uncharacterized protein n=1 Tax=Naganishia friedmannii TaxID=89922 RepID=A0ACC2VNY8_9TREE|nr:hypothetical protein QFC21_003326 [Naganishia friedmannii]
MITHTSSPLNAEPDSTSLIQNDVTPTSLLFHRNHGPVPSDARAAVERNTAQRWDVLFQLEQGVVPAPQQVEKEVTVSRLKQYETVHEDIALQCAGNRRALYAHSEDPATQGIPWQEGTIANIVWTGCLLRTVLLDLFPFLESKANDEDWHVVFESTQDCGEDEGGLFGGSIPGRMAM